MGLRVSSQRLTEEYAKADPIFASKTKVDLLIRTSVGTMLTSPRTSPTPILSTAPSKAMAIVAFEVGRKPVNCIFQDRS